MSGCVSRDVIIEHQTIYVTEPEIYQHCLTEPSPPPVGASNKAWKDYQLELKRYGNDCEGKVNGGREWTRRHVPPSPENSTKTDTPESKQEEEGSVWDRLWNNQSTPAKSGNPE